MIETSTINPSEHPARCEKYLSHSLASRVRFVEF